MTRKESYSSALSIESLDDLRSFNIVGLKNPVRLTFQDVAVAGVAYLAFTQFNDAYVAKKDKKRRSGSRK